MTAKRLPLGTSEGTEVYLCDHTNPLSTRRLLNKLRPGSFSLPITNVDEHDGDASCSDRDDDETDSVGPSENKQPKFTLEHSDQDEEVSRQKGYSKKN